MAKTAVAIAVSVFNDGASALMAVMQEMGLKPGTFARDFCEQKDILNLRIKSSQKWATEESLGGRRAKRRRRLALDDQQEETEGLPYLAGGH